MTFRLIIGAVSGLLVSYGQAFADGPGGHGGPGGPPVDEGWTFFAGGGTFVTPGYSGDDEYNVMIVPFVRVTNGERFFASMQEGVGYKITKNRGYEAGPLLTLEMGRERKGGPFQVFGGDNDDLIGFKDVNPTIGVGGFADYQLGPIKLTSKASKALGSHKGFSGEVAANFETRLFEKGPPLMAGIGPKLKFADSNYMQAFYGVTAEQSEDSGLASYDADGGVVSYGVGASLMMPITRSVILRAFGSYDRLTGEAADSPLVTERGDPDQVFGGVIVVKKF